MNFVVLVFINLFFLQQAHSQDASVSLSEEFKTAKDSEIFHSAYQQYQALSQDYIQNQKETIEALRSWRKSLLTEAYSDRLDVIEKNLNLSNSSLIESFDSFISENGTVSLDDVLMMRLAQLNFEKANLDFNAEMKKYQQKLDLYGNGGLSEPPEIPIPNYKKTIQIAADFVKSYAESPLIDKSLYLLGFCNEEMDQNSKAMEYYTQIIEKFPNSIFFDEVTWRSADYYFSIQNYTQAEILYSKLVQIKSIYELRALYKLAAAQFAKKNYDLSIEKFESLILKIESIPSKNLEQESLLDESYDYLAAIVSQFKAAKIQARYTAEVFYRLGQIYKKRLDEESMKTAYAYAIQMQPDSPWMPRVYSELITAYEDDSDSEKVNLYRNKFIQLLTQNNMWWSKNEDFKLVTFEAQDFLELHLLKSAQFYALKGYKANNSELLETARTRYFNFITKYSWSPFAERAKLELADIEYHLKRYTQASKYYFELINDAESAVVRENAAYSLIWSESKKVQYDLTFSSGFYLSKSSEKTSLSLQETTYVQASNYYANKIPRSFRRNKILYKMAEIYAAHGDLGLSIQNLNLIISNAENSDFTTLKAYRFLADIYNIKNDWKSVQVVYELQKTQSYIPSVEDQDPNDLLSQSMDKLEFGFDFELSGKYSEAADFYEKFILENPRSQVVPMLQLKLAVLYEKSGQLEKLQQTLAKLEKTNFVAESAYLKAQLLSRQSFFDDAAKAFEEFSLKYPTHSWFEAAALNALSIRSQMNQHAQMSAFIQKTQLLKQSPYVFYVYLNAQYELKKYDEVLKLANTTRLKGALDSSRILNFILKSYYAKDDFISLSKTCPSIKVLNESKNKTAYLNYNLAFCKFVDLRAIVSVPETTMGQIQSELNEIASYKVDEILVLSVNTVLELSQLKNSNRNEFFSYAQKAWDVAKLNPFNKTSKSLAKNYFQIFSKYPIHLGQLMNWRLSFYKMYDFKNLNIPEWKDIQAACEQNRLTCSEGLETLAQKTTESSPFITELYENLILSYVNRGEDRNAIRVLKQFAQKLNWPQKAVDLYFVFGISNQIPSEKLKYESQLSSPLGVIAVIEREIGAKNYKDALKFIKMNLSVNPQYPLTYARAAQFYYERGYPELARTVLNNGVSYTQSEMLEGLLYQLNAVTFSNTQIGKNANAQDFGLNQKYGLAFASLKNKDPALFSELLLGLKGFKVFEANLKWSQQLYSNAKVEIEEESSSYHALWMKRLEAFSRLQNPNTFENLKDLNSLGYRHPSLSEIEQISNYRTPAGGL